MPRKATIKGEVVVEYLRNFPNESSLAIARKLYAENKEIFSGVENARANVRYYRGALGNKSRGDISKAKLEEFARKFEKIQVNPFDLPETDEAEWLPFYLSQDCKKILWLSDIHIPYHSIEALTAAIQKGLDEGVDTIFLGGDILDCYQGSRFEKDPRKRHLGDELEMGRQFLDRLRATFPKARIYYKEGNHDERYENYLKSHAAELLDMNEFRLDVILRLGEKRIEFINEKRVCYAGKLRMVHGHEFGRSIFSPVNPARGYYMKAKQSLIAGHNHQSSQHHESDIDGNIVRVVTTGCLCELHPEYARINKWNHGFAIIEMREAGNYIINNYSIIDGEVYE